MVDFFSEKIVNYIFTTNGASLLYRSFFRIFSDLLLGALLLDSEDYFQSIR